MRKAFSRGIFFLNVSVSILFGSAIFSCTTVTVKEHKPSKEISVPASGPSSPLSERPAPKAAPPSARDIKDEKILGYLSDNKKAEGESAPTSYLGLSGRGNYPDELKGITLPRDRFGLIDWVKFQKKKVVSPRWTLDPEMTPDDEMTIDSNILFETKSKFMENVVFSHELHSGFLSCETCHETSGGAIFNMEAGSNKVRMTDIVQGKWCGRCHGKVAFPLEDCKRCHVRPKRLKVSEDLIKR